MPKLIFTTPEGDIHKYDLSLERVQTSIGRAPDNKICLPHISVSSRHALIDRLPGGLTITDLNSTNGLVANHVLQQNVALKKDTLYKIGEVHLICYFTPSEEDFLAKELAEVSFIRANPI